MKEIEVFVKECCFGDASGHDWWHIDRVRNLALHLGKAEGGDLRIIETAALLHDTIDWKFHDADSKSVLKSKILIILESLAFTPIEIEHIFEIVDTVSFKGAGEKSEMTTLEGKVVQDADRLDALGAIGIARTFAYGGNKNQAMYNPSIPVTMHKNFSEYKTKESTSINHFYEKLFLLKDLMNTETAKKIAVKRHDLMESFVEEFLNEWEGRMK